MTAMLEEQDTTTTFLWLELTGNCPLECLHCYAESSPLGTHGTMTEADWIRVIDQAAKHGVQMIQFIGGEPMRHSSLPALINHALGLGIKVEVFSSLVAVPAGVWQALEQPGVRLAASYYSGTQAEHEKITGRRGSYAKTKANIAEAVRRGITLRVGLIEMLDKQDIDGARRELAELGVPEDYIGWDRLRQVGRGISDEDAGIDQLCGRCDSGRAAVLPDGTVYPCVFSRWMEPVGDARVRSLDGILEGEHLREVREHLNAAFGIGNRGFAAACATSCLPDAPCVPVMPPCIPA